MITIEITPLITQVVPPPNIPIFLEVSPLLTEVVACVERTKVVEASVAIPPLSSSNILVTPYKTITSTVLQTALEQLADQNFRGDSEPVGDNVEVGDTWYDTANNIFYAYRTVDGVTDWYPIINGDAGQPDQLDGGAF